MTIPAIDTRPAWRRLAATCGAVLLMAACTPAEEAQPPAPQSTAPDPSVEVALAAPITPVEPANQPAPAPAPANPSAPAVVPPVAAQAAPKPASTPPPPAPGRAPGAEIPVVTPVRAGLPAGPGRETVQQVCTSCHAIGMVTANGRTSEGWAEIIERMMGLGMEASDEDLQTVHAYLTRELPPRRAN